MVNTAKVRIPEGYVVPKDVTEGRAKDFAMAYWLTKEIGVVAMFVRGGEVTDLVLRPSFIRLNIVIWRKIGCDLQLVRYLVACVG
jgi:hypothetical protein